MHHRRSEGRAQRRALCSLKAIAAASLLAASPAVAAAVSEPPAVLGIPVDFILFALTLLGVAVFHHYTFYVALAGLATITVYKLAFTGFKTGPGIPGLIGHLAHEWVILTNLLCLLLRFALLSRHFEDSKVPVRKPEWSLLPEATKGTIFLLSLVTSASMMPVEKLPVASWQTAMGLGFVSAVFDNIPLTALALKQSGYDWGMLAYTVGFGGSMIWFGSSAGVALSNMYPEAKNVGRWLFHGWHVTLAYVLGFLVLLAVLGWQPAPKRGDPPLATPAASVPKAAAPAPAPTVSMAGRQPAATPPHSSDHYST